ncbi:MAG: pyridoxal-phosphate dependent enzyme [Gemmatimonadota bacterium]
MSHALPAVRPISLDEILAARDRIAGTVFRTPLVPLDLGPGFPEILVKLETLQPINSYKLRGAANAVALLSPAERDRGVWTVSAGNAGQGVAWAARAAGIPCTVVAVESAPVAKLDRMRELGARVVPVPFDVAWQAMEEHQFEGIAGTFIHPFDHHDFIAGHGTIALEILEDAPDIATVIAPIGGGGLIAGIGSVLKTLRPEIALVGSEPETGSPAALTAATGIPQPFPGWRASFVDGAGGKSMLPRMWQRIAPLVNQYVVVTLEETRAAMRLLASRARVVSEGAGALALAAALTGKAGNGPIAVIVSGGNIDLEKFATLISAGSNS